MTLLAWQRGGVVGGPAVVLAHAWASDGATDWQASGWVEALVLAGADVLVCDLPGHGQSADIALPGTSEPAAWTASAILADLRKLGVSSFAAAGYAEGGVVAGHLAVRAPDQARCLVLISIDDRARSPHAAEIAAGLRDPGVRVWNPDAAETIARARRDRRHDLPALADWIERAAWPAAARLGALRAPALLAVGVTSPQRERVPMLAKLFHDARVVTAPGDTATVLAAPELIATVTRFVTEPHALRP